MPYAKVLDFNRNMYIPYKKPVLGGMKMLKGLKYKLITYGCQMNEYDSEFISSILESHGCIPVEHDEDADIIILNTCCVRDTADQKVYGRLGQYKNLKRKKPNLTLVVCGCLAQKDKAKLQNRFPHVDLVLGTQNLHEIVPAIEEARVSRLVLKVDEEGATFLTPVVRKNPVRAYITISIGCDCFCSFCIVPYVRGRLKSRPLEDVLKEARDAASKGYKEIFLLGQNVNTYGDDLPHKPTFAYLLEKLNEIDGIQRIRFTSPHPKDFSKDLIEALGKLDKVCEWVHLPLQSGSDTVLKRMNRKYDTKRFKEIVDGLRSSIDGVAISTDIIVGFPCETDEEFEESLSFIKSIEFDQAFMFAYSIRSGTAAAKMKNQIPKEIKMARLYRLIDLQNEITRRKNESEVGREVEVLVESISKKKSDVVTGRTRTNKVVNFKGDESLIGKLVWVKLKKAYTWGFMGEMMKVSD